MSIVSDTSPLIALSKIDKLHILQKLFRNVLIPGSVADEFLKNCTVSERRSFENVCKEFIEIVEVNELYEFKRRLDTGEREALILAIREKTPVIIDDRKGFNEAAEQKVTAVSTRAVLRIAEKKKIISDYRELENALIKKSYFLPDY